MMHKRNQPIKLSCEHVQVKTMKYREDFHFVDWFHGSLLHSDRCNAGCEGHTNFADESHA
jgi:hypothetical protein